MKLPSKFLNVLFIVGVFLAAHFIDNYFDAKTINKVNFVLFKEGSKVEIQRHLSLLKLLRENNTDKAILYLEGTLDSEINHIGDYSDFHNNGEIPSELIPYIEKIAEYRKEFPRVNQHPKDSYGEQLTLRAQEILHETTKLPNHTIKADEN